MVAPDAVQLGWRRGRAARIPTARPPSRRPSRTGRGSSTAPRTCPRRPSYQQGDEEGGVFTLVWRATDAAAALYGCRRRGTGRTTARRRSGAAPETRALAVRAPGRVDALTTASARSPADGGRLVERDTSCARRSPGGGSCRSPRPTCPPASSALQLALLRLCAARGDLFAVLALPEHYREREAASHVRALRAAAGPPGGRARPRVRVRRRLPPVALLLRPGDADRLPADAARRRGGGRDRALAVDPARRLGRARRTSRCATSCALDPRDRPRRVPAPAGRAGQPRPPGAGRLPVARRRHAQSDDETCGRSTCGGCCRLLRRVALLHGTAYVFEPNGDALRRAVSAGSRSCSGGMFERGAFAGATPAEGFRVDDRLAAEHAASRRRRAGFIVELRVAPSRPLAFLTVRLVQHRRRPAARWRSR